MAIRYQKSVKKVSKNGQNVKKWQKSVKMAKIGHFLVIFWTFVQNPFFYVFISILTRNNPKKGQKMAKKGSKKGQKSAKPDRGVHGFALFWPFLTLF